MPILSLSSKKCLIANGLFVVSVSVFAGTAFASTAPSTRTLRTEIQSDHSSSFEPLLEQWSDDYGPSAIKPLLAVAKDHTNSDRVRYIALMGAAKLGGLAGATQITPFLKDSSWMLRNGALRALSALDNPQTAAAVLPLLQDPALVVRLEAVEAVRKLKPHGAAQALVNTLRSQDNYHNGKSQWVPIRSLDALAELRDPSIIPALKPLLDHRHDPELQRQTISTLRALTGKNLALGLPLPKQITTWKKELSSR
jgi:HEAT repeat protein